MVQGLDRLARKLKRLPKEVRTQVLPTLKKAGDEINALQRNLVPVEHGVLRSTIRNHVEEDRLRVVIEAGGPATTREVRQGADAEYDYALGQEFGTREMPANPFFMPGYRALKKSAKSRIARAMGKAARIVAGK